MENLEEILQELTNFEKQHRREIPKLLEEYLVSVAHTGETVFPWSKVKPLLKVKLEQVMEMFHAECPPDDIPAGPNSDPFHYEHMKENIMDRVESFSNAPFTIQRLCELVTEPRRHYKYTDKFMRAVEKNILVVSSVDLGRPVKRLCSESQQHLVNGLVESVVEYPGVTLSSVLPGFPEVSSTHVLPAEDGLAAGSHGSNMMHLDPTKPVGVPVILENGEKGEIENSTMEVTEEDDVEASPPLSTVETRVPALICTEVCDPSTVTHMGPLSSESCLGVVSSVTGGPEVEAQFLEQQAPETSSASSSSSLESKVPESSLLAEDQLHEHPPDSSVDTSIGIFGSEEQEQTTEDSPTSEDTREVTPPIEEEEQINVPDTEEPLSESVTEPITESCPNTAIEDIVHVPSLPVEEVLPEHTEALPEEEDDEDEEEEEEEEEEEVSVPSTSVHTVLPPVECLVRPSQTVEELQDCAASLIVHDHSCDTSTSTEGSSVLKDEL